MINASRYSIDANSRYLAPTSNVFKKEKLGLKDSFCAFAVAIIASLGALFSKESRTIAYEAWTQLLTRSRFIALTEKVSTQNPQKSTDLATPIVRHFPSTLTFDDLPQTMRVIPEALTRYNLRLQKEQALASIFLLLNDYSYREKLPVFINVKPEEIKFIEVINSRRMVLSRPLDELRIFRPKPKPSLIQIQISPEMAARFALLIKDTIQSSIGLIDAPELADQPTGLELALI